MIILIFYFDHLQISGSNILQRPDKDAEGKADCAASIGGMSASHKALLAFRKAEGGERNFNERAEHSRHI